MFAQIENQADLIKHSVTEGDVANQYKPGSNAVWRVYLPAGYGEQVVGTLPAELPRYWTPIRDRYTRATVLNESLWAASVAIACTKTASLSFEIESDVPQRVKRAQEMMLALNGTGYVPGVSVGVRDFLTTDNGEFWEIVRVSNAAGSKILGLMHLDSIRCTRTGDPSIPLLYRDLKGAYHELKDYQCIMMSDMPSAAAELFGVGYCAASRAYTHIYKMAAIDRYFNEKITGSKANAIEFVSGVTEKTIDTAMKSADEDRNQRGLQSYKGVTIVPVYSDKGTVSGYHVDIAGIPDNFDRKEEFDIAITIYADAIGLDPQDLKPLSGQGLGTGAQSHVQQEKSKGKGLSARRKDFTQKINEDVFPEGVTFYFKEVDLTDDQKKAEIAAIRATTRQTQVSNGEITNVEARALAVEQDDLPKEYMPQEDNPLDDTLGDEEKQDTPEQILEQSRPQIQQQQPMQMQPTQQPNDRPLTPQQEEEMKLTKKEIQVLETLTEEIRLSREELKKEKEVAPTVQPQQPVIINMNPNGVIPDKKDKEVKLLPPPPPPVVNVAAAKIDVSPIAKSVESLSGGMNKIVESVAIGNKGILDQIKSLVQRKESPPMIIVQPPDMSPIADAIRAIGEAIQNQQPPNVTVNFPQQSRDHKVVKYDAEGNIVSIDSVTEYEE